MKLWMWIVITAVVFLIIGWYAKSAQAQGKLGAFAAGAGVGAAVTGGAQAANAAGTQAGM